MSYNSDPLAWVIRIFNVFAGLIHITASILIFAQIGLNTDSVLIILAVTLIIVSCVRLLNSAFNKRLNTYLRISRLIVGIAILILSSISFITTFTESTKITLLTIAILVNGIQRLLDGRFKKYYPVWFRILSTIVGLVTIILCTIVFVGTSFDIYTLIVLLAVTFMLNGIGRIMNAISTLNRSSKKHF
ncbi:MAG: hypothetical protein KGD64_05565 [Candidatus Heimdallarchaeota archaeon]|nr:hypothetical protein [Candidatus Heimdallarchaeota archaeon]